MKRESAPLVRLRRTLTAGNLWLYILSTLMKRRTYAYALKNQIEKRFGWKPGLITSYIVFYKLESEGLITSTYDKRRKYYEITARGKAELREGKRIMRETLRRL